MKLVLRSVVGLLLTVGASALIACGSSDAGGGTAGAGASAQGGGGASAGGSSNGGSNPGGANQGGSAGSNKGGSNPGGSSQGGGSQGGSSQGGSSQGGSGGGSCEGNFTLGETFYTSGNTETLGKPCDPMGAPKNCPDGTWIEFPSTNECICIVKCSSLQGVKEGDPCTTDSSWMCEKIKATNASANSATVCVPTKWGLCTSGGTGQGGSGGGGTGGSEQGGSGGSEQGGSGGGGQCAGSGADCSFDDDCCSGTCDMFTCT